MLFRVKGDYNEAQNWYNKFSHSTVSYYLGTNWMNNTDSLHADLLKHLEDSIRNTIQQYFEGKAL